MAITMIDPVEVAAKEFPESHLFLMLQRMIVVAHVFESEEILRNFERDAGPLPEIPGRLLTDARALGRDV